MDSNKGGSLDRNEFKEGIKRYCGRNLVFTDAELESIAKACDVSGDGDIDYEEFLAQLRVNEFFFFSFTALTWK
jgi:Ca2+-binding EF-hand superfamily protein